MESRFLKLYKKLLNCFPNCIHTSNVWKFQLLRIITSTWSCRLKSFSHSDVCCFNFYFPDDWWAEASFHVLIGHSYVNSFMKSLFRSFHLKNLIVFLLNCESSSCSLNSGYNLSDLCFGSIFYKSAAGLPSYFINGIFKRANVLNFMSVLLTFRLCVFCKILNIFCLNEDRKHFLHKVLC